MSRPLTFGGLCTAALLGATLLSCAGAPPTPAPTNAATMTEPTPTWLIDPEDDAATAALVAALADRRVVFVGETHDRYDHHLNQLAVIRGLHARGVPIAIGMEQFQRPFQPHLDDFIAGRIDEATLFERTEWARRWRFDPALYRDILRFARAEGIPIVALNASTETLQAVSRGGIDALPAAERAFFPADIELASGAYRDYLAAVMSGHGHRHGGPEHLERFLQAQYVWDQTMAQQAADFMNRHPDHRLVVLAGAGHLVHDEAIPSRVRALAPGAQAVVITDTGFLPPGASPDFVFAARDRRPGDGRLLAAAGRDGG